MAVFFAIIILNVSCSARIVRDVEETKADCLSVCVKTSSARRAPISRLTRLTLVLAAKESGDGGTLGK